jgi:hypothetical protein
MLLLAVLAACAGGSVGAPEGAACLALWGAPQEVEIGTGAEAFEPLAAGDEIDVVQTPQGLLAVYGSLQTEGILHGDEGDLTHPSNPRVSFEVVDDELTLGGYRSLPRPLHATGATTGVLVGDVLALDPETAYEALGRPAELRVEVVDACGTVVHSARRVLLRQAF